MKKRRGAIRARLGVADHRSTTPRWGNPVQCLSQQHNKRTCRLFRAIHYAERQPKKL